MAKLRNRNYDKEVTKAQKLTYENKKLKNELSRLRKELNKLEHRYENLDSAVQHQHDEVSDEELRAKWKCFKCNKDYLRILIIPRPDGIFYLRRCPCGNKTKLQKYTDEVEGIKE